MKPVFRNEDGSEKENRFLSDFWGHRIRPFAVVSKAHALESGGIHRKVLRRNEVFVLIYFDRTILALQKLLNICEISVL
jgi:hypothetical protein